MTAFFFSWLTNYRGGAVSRLILESAQCKQQSTNLPEKPRNEVAKDNGLVGLIVVVGRRDGSSIPQVSFPLVHVAVCRLGVEEEDSGGTLDQPAPIQYANATLLHGLDCRREFGVGGLHLFDLDGRLENTPL